MKYRVVMHRQAIKDLQKLKQAGLSGKARALAESLSDDPYQNPPPYEKLVGDLKGAYSRRINVQHRMVYCIDEDAGEVKILRMWSHYE